MSYLSYILLRKILFTISWLLVKRVEAILDAYKSGTRAAQDHSSHLVTQLLGFLWWLIGTRRDV